MLSIAKLTSASAARAYFDKDNYYTRGADAASEWFGKGAAKLHLESQVDAARFEALLDGRVKDGAVLGRIVDGVRQRQSGWDLTFSAPKSVSLLAEALGDETLKRAHRDAVIAALGFVEERLLTTRIFSNKTGGQERVAGQGMVAALFHHDTSRAGDPQTHTHAVLVNLALGEDGAWRSLVSRTLYENRNLIGAYYRSALAVELRARGYALETTQADGRFELRGFPKPVIDAFSQRAAAIRASMEERGLSGGKNAAEAALRTRAPKQTQAREALRDDWLERAKALGVDLGALRNVLRAKAPIKAVEHGASALGGAVRHLSERQSAFLERDLLQTALARSASLGAAPERVLLALQRAKTSSRLVAGDGARSHYVTTNTAIARARDDLFDAARTGQERADR